MHNKYMIACSKLWPVSFASSSEKGGVATQWYSLSYSFCEKTWTQSISLFPTRIYALTSVLYAASLADMPNFCLGSCYPITLLLGDDMRLCSVWKLCGLWRSGQHLLHLQPENPWGKCACQPWAGRAHRWGGRAFIYPSSPESTVFLLISALFTILSPFAWFATNVFIEQIKDRFLSVTASK